MLGGDCNYGCTAVGRGHGIPAVHLSNVVGHLFRRDLATRVSVHPVEGLLEPLVALVDGGREDGLELRCATEGLQSRLKCCLAPLTDFAGGGLRALHPRVKA